MDLQLFNQKKHLIKIKYEGLKRIQSDLHIRMELLLCSLKLSEIYKDLNTKIENGLLQGISLPALELLYASEGQFRSFRILVDNSKILYTKYGIKSISVIIPWDSLTLRSDEYSPKHLPETIEIALLDKSDKLNYNHPVCNDVLSFTNYEELLIGIDKLINYNDDDNDDSSLIE